MLNLEVIREYIPILVNIAQIVTVPLIAYTLIVYIRQARAMEKQLLVQEEHIKHIQESRSELQFYQVISSLLDMRPYIEHVLSLENKPFSSWTEKDKEAGIYVAGQFHFVGVLVYEKLIQEDLLAKTWPYNIQKCHKVLQPFILNMRNERGARYWSGFDFLAKRVAEITATFKGFV